MVEREGRRHAEIDAVVTTRKWFQAHREKVEDQRKDDGDDSEIVPGQTHREHTRDECHGHCGDDAERKDRPKTEMQLVDADADTVHPKSEIKGLTKRQQYDIAEQKIDARGK